MNPKTSPKSKIPPRTEQGERSTAPALRSHLFPVFSLTSIFFINFLSRVILAPLLVTIEKELSLSHEQAGVLFLFISAGYSLSLLGSGYLSSRLSHRKSIFCSSQALGVTLLALSVCQSLWSIRLGLFTIGLCAGLYLPSGVATLTAMIRHQDWGKAIAIHELAPNISFVAAPFIGQAFLSWASWRWLLASLGAASIILGINFIRFNQGDDSYGKAPTPRVVSDLLRKPSFWIIMILFGLGVGTSFGIYSMLPLYMVMERGLTQGWANSLIALSRLSGVFIAFMAGFFVDRLGIKKTMAVFLFLTGILTVLLGSVHGGWLIACVFLQPMMAVCFFPAGFSAISRIGSPENRNVAISFTVPLGFLMGGGAVPTLIGWAGERGSFSLGIIVIGIFTLACLPLIRWLRFSQEQALLG
jgi:MFS transporter, NNP family, nitrate/nitrite transporter